MAVKTEFTPKDLGEILAAYDLGALHDAEPLPGGTVQTNYLLRTPRGKVVFRCYGVRTLEQVKFERDLILYLTAAGYPCPALVPDREGVFLGSFQGRPFAIFEFIAGEHVADPSAEQHTALVRKAAELQLLSGGFSSGYTAYRWNYSPGLCLQLAREEAGRLSTKEGYAKLSWLERRLAALDLPPSLPAGICHGDFHFSNVLFRDGEFAALIDFDDANITYQAFDLVGLIEYRAWPDRKPLLDLETAREVIGIYSARRPLAGEEREHLYDVYQLSILFDCIWYFDRWEGDSFREKKKLEALQELGREQFAERLFGAADFSSDS